MSLQRRLRSAKQRVAAWAVAAILAVVTTDRVLAEEPAQVILGNTISSVERAWQSIPSAGQVMKFSLGTTKIAPGGHLQGIQLALDAGLDRHVAFLSHDSQTVAYLLIVEFPRALPGDGRVIGLRELPSDGQSPPLRHSGGMQLLGNVLAVGLEDNQRKTRSEIQFWNVDEPEKPAQMTHLTIHRSGPPKEKTAGAVGLVEREKDHLLAVANWDSRAIDFYASNGRALDDPQCRFELAVRWQVETADKDDWSPDSTFGAYQAVNLVSDAHRDIFLIGFDTTPAGEDVVDLFAVRTQREPAGWLAKRARKQMQLAGANHFRYAGGAWIHHGRISVLASQRDLIGEVRLSISK